MDADVIVLGAGIAGLLIASELSKQASVIVIEKESSIPKNKYWLTNKRSVSLNPELKHCIDSHYGFIDISCYDETSFRCEGDFYLWDTDKLLQHLRAVIDRNDGQILTGVTFESHECFDDYVEVRSERLTFRCALIIDCMGFGSPIINGNKILNATGYYILYGKTLKLKKPLDPIGFCNPVKQPKATYFEAFPTCEGNAHCVIIAAESQPYPWMNLKAEFEKMIEDSWLSAILDSKSVSTAELGGIIPIGELDMTAMNRLLFFGESRQLNPASTATALTRMLYTYKKLSQQVIERLQSNKLSMKHLDAIDVTFLSSFNRKFQLNVFKESLSWDSDQFKRLVRQMQNLGSEMVYDILFGDLEARSVLDPTTLLHLIRSRNSVLLRNAARALF
ncbi:MAG: lycopene cyclase family protein [bacterium]